MAVKREKKKIKIMEAAIKIFAQKGFTNAKMVDVAEAAGVGKGTLYEYFRSKEALFLEIVEYFLCLYFREIEGKIGTLKDSRRKLRLFIDHSFEFYEGFADALSVLFMFWAEGFSKRASESTSLTAVYERYRDYIAQMIQGGIAKGYFKKVVPQEYASMIVAAIDGLCLQWVVDMRRFPLKKAGKTLSKTVLNGLLQD